MITLARSNNSLTFIGTHVQATTTTLGLMHQHLAPKAAIGSACARVKVVRATHLHSPALHAHVEQVQVVLSQVESTTTTVAYNEIRLAKHSNREAVVAHAYGDHGDGMDWSMGFIICVVGVGLLDWKRAGSPTYTPAASFTPVYLQHRI